ncbi:glutathione S-transferase [Ciceribacter sp. L1K22]|uniref:glutathione S-transferase family protein n=1 Tax=Ciceribacter sp. L1K22 TaxID=2820275 RepID=UPI001ABE1035|nr:glutathione S-transferase [Ciceribacter sp. L1K22]MBO3760951.1 glutathione S-transferase [Ciceribacter sp. L1K22]
MILVHYLENSRAHRILWLLEELAVPYEVNVYRRRPDMQAPPELKAVHPLGKSPVIEDDGRTIAESGAIIEYLVQTYGGDALRPRPGTDEALRYTYWLHYAEGSAMPLLVMKLIFSKLPGQVPLLIRPVAGLISNGVSAKLLDPQLANHLAFWESEVSRGGYFAGEAFSAADIAMSFPVETAMSRYAGAADTRNLRAWLNAIRSRGAYSRALERGGLYAYSET